MYFRERDMYVRERYEYACACVSVTDRYVQVGQRQGQYKTSAQSCCNISSNGFKLCALAHNGGGGSGRISALLALLRLGAILEFGLLWMNITRTGNLLTFASVSDQRYFLERSCPPFTSVSPALPYSPRSHRDAGTTWRIFLDSSVWILFLWITTIKNHNIDGLLPFGQVSAMLDITHGLISAIVKNAGVYLQLWFGPG